MEAGERAHTRGETETDMGEHNIFVATCIVTLVMHGNRSLKDKRSVLNRVKTRVRNEFNVSAAEVGDADRRQVAQVGLVSIGNDRQYLDGQMRRVVDFIAGISHAEVSGVHLNVEIYGGDDVFL